MDGENLNGRKVRIEYQFEKRMSTNNNNNNNGIRDDNDRRDHHHHHHNGMGGPGGRDKNRGCYFCGDLNHWANDCPYNNGIRVSEGRCFGCGSKTHTI